VESAEMRTKLIADITVGLKSVAKVGWDVADQSFQKINKNNRLTNSRG